MLKVSAKEFIELGERIEQARVIFHLTSNYGPSDSGRALKQGELEEMKARSLPSLPSVTSLRRAMLCGSYCWR